MQASLMDVGEGRKRKWKFSEKSSQAIHNGLLSIKALSLLNIKGALSEAVFAHTVMLYYK